MKMRNKPRKPLPLPLKTAIKWAVFIITAAIAFAFSTAGGSSHSKALALLPLALSISVFSEEIPSAAMGGFAGLLIDISQGQLIGFTALYLCLCCGLVSALFRQFLRKNFINYAAAVIVCVFAYLYIQYFFYYRIWEYEGYGLVLKSRLLPSALKTLIWAPVWFVYVWLITKLSGKKKTLEIEEADEKIDRV